MPGFVSRLSEELPSDNASPAQARRLLNELLTSAGFASGSTEVAAARLVVSELVTNAVLHSGEPIRFEAGVTEYGVEIAVMDGHADFPEVARPTPGTAGGWGIYLTDHLSDSWGVAQRRDGMHGKAVWANFLLRR